MFFKTSKSGKPIDGLRIVRGLFLEAIGAKHRNAPRLCCSLKHFGRVWLKKTKKKDPQKKVFFAPAP